MTAPAAIYELVEKFEQHNQEYQQRKNETELRREFLDPLFEALGWDVFNRKSNSEKYKEVIHERSVEVEGKAKAADYAFRVGDKTVFLLEAKKPSVRIETNPEPAFQLRRYGWSLKLPISLLSDFEQLAVYDCRVGKPEITDRPSLGRIKLYHYSEYVEKWDQIAALFSREVVLQGALDQIAEEQKGRKNTVEVDDAFLQEIERWRDLLARNIALRNPQLIRNERDLNYAVQMTIDRIIFLRICEDRGIEPDEQLRELANHPHPASPKSDGPQSDLGEVAEGRRGSIYAELLALFKRADTKYNSGLFHLAGDNVTLDLQIDDKALKTVVRNLYYPESPYAFNYISADILGQVYEQFLGKVIRLTAGHQAKVEEKPEVRKAGGVYYTPLYIVDYIVKNTVGKLLDPSPGPSPDGEHVRRGGMTPKEAAKLKVLDPACGSGSFLLGAYEFLLDWHTNWYAHNEPEKWARSNNPPIFQADKGEWKLTTAEKKRILLDNIHGVDIDAQAVEVTKLSLLLKVLEGESGQLGLGLERALPDLGANIQCGNSLIGPDYYDGRQMPMFGDEEFYRVNVFDWQRAFPQVFTTGGFDAVIGNPPYLFITELNQADKKYYFDRYSSTEYRFDVYGLFTELSVELLLKESGYASFIIPHTLLSNDSFTKLRRILLEKTTIELVIDIGPGVFENARNETMIFAIRKGINSKDSKTKVILTTSKFFPIPQKEFLIDQSIWAINQNSAWQVNVSDSDLNIVGKLEKVSLRLGDICTINQGLRTGDNEKYLSNLQATNSWKPAIGGKHVGRYESLQKELYVYYEPKVLDAPRKPEIFESQEKLVVQEIRNITLARRIIATYDNEQFYCLQSTNVINLRPQKNAIWNLKYLLGVLNSAAINYFFRQRFSGNNHIASNQLGKIPTPEPDKATHDRLVSLVESMLALHKRLPSARTPQEQEMLSRQIEATDGQIDRLVYGLYGLTEAEIGIVEGA